MNKSTRIKLSPVDRESIEQNNIEEESRNISKGKMAK